MVVLKILMFMLLVNGAPPLVARLLPGFVRWQLDGGLYFIDGHPLLGAHKTVGGFVAGVIAGGICAVLISVPLWVGLGAGLSAMAGDCLSSFIKRRLGLEDGRGVFLLDHLFEGLFPTFFLYIYSPATLMDVLISLGLFVGLAWILSEFFSTYFKHPGQRQGKAVTKTQVPSSNDGKNHRKIFRSRSRFKEWRACHTALSPLARVLNFESVVYYRFFMEACFRCVGLYGKGMKNALELRLNEFSISFENLPHAFHGYRVLFLTDLHLDGLNGLEERVREIISGVDADICIMGGDYRMEMYGPFERANHALGSLIGHIRTRDGIFGVLGNHDCLAIAPDLEDSGICMLINDSFTLERNGALLSIVGVDDPHYYKCHDLEQAMQDVPKDAFVILVSHSPEIINYTDGRGIDLCLCGHTHGGQICLPYIGPVFTHCRTPRLFTSGRWRYGTMRGYTSNGIGASGIPVRFNCPPEVALITLKCADLHK